MRRRPGPAEPVAQAGGLYSFAERWFLDHRKGRAAGAQSECCTDGKPSVGGQRAAA